MFYLRATGLFLRLLEETENLDLSKKLALTGICETAKGDYNIQAAARQVVLQSSADTQ